MSTIPAHLEPGEPRPHPLVPTITATIFDERIHGSGIIRISVERVMHDWTFRHPVRRSRQLLRRNVARHGKATVSVAIRARGVDEVLQRSVVVLRRR